MKLLTVVPSRGDNEWAQEYTVFTFFFFKSAYVVLLYNLTESRIYILCTGVNSTNQSHVLTTTHLPVMCCVKGQPRGICHPKEAPPFSYVSVWFVIRQTLCFMLPRPFSVIGSGPRGLHLPSATAVGGVSDICFLKRIIIFTFASSWMQIGHIVLY